MKRANTSDPDKAILIYLFKIAQNVLTDYWKQINNTNPNPYDGSEKIIKDLPQKNQNPNPADLSIHGKAVLNALSYFSYKHKVIFLTYTQYEENGFKLPRKLLASLRVELNLSQNTIRAYKFEIFNKIKEFEEIYGQKR